MKIIGKPYSGKPNVRFDEGELEIEPSATTPALYSTAIFIDEVSFVVGLPDNPCSPFLLIPLLRQRLPSKFSNPAFCHLISPIDSSFKIGILIFFKEPLLIIG
jgi:hypothetical protein